MAETPDAPTRAEKRRRNREYNQQVAENTRKMLNDPEAYREFHEEAAEAIAVQQGQPSREELIAMLRRVGFRTVSRGILPPVRVCNCCGQRPCSPYCDLAALLRRAEGRDDG